LQLTHYNILYYKGYNVVHSKQIAVLFAATNSIEKFVFKIVTNSVLHYILFI